jgi:hypothetical protein
MYTLIGFIQILLMLTQNRLVPDLSFVWREEKAAAVTVMMPAIKTTWHLPVTGRQCFRIEALREDDKDKWQAPVWSGEPAVGILRQQKLVLPKVVAGNGKLYLIFCQLKTEG